MTKKSLNTELLIKNHFQESAETKKKTALVCMKDIVAAGEIFVEVCKSGGKILICGNGGSAADAQHMAGEFVCLLHRDFQRPGLPAIALTTDASIVTAQSNDSGFETVFKRQVEALGKKGDVLVGISTSGTSPNIISAITVAKKMEIRTILLTGNNPGVKHSADVVIGIPSNDTQFVQESHLAVEHILCEIVERRLFHGNQ
jgi:D-sedoheptulose 7-phosphate isomerase